MLYPKKPLIVFSIVALSTAVVAGFFIRQKVLSDWEIEEFNSLLKQIKELETEIKKDKKELEEYEKLKTNKEENNEDIDKKIKELEESIKDNDLKIKNLNVNNISSKKAKWIEKIFQQYQELKNKINNSSEQAELNTWKTFFSSYNKILLNYIDNKNNISGKLQEYQNIKQQKEKEKENLKKEVENNKGFLSELIIEINKLIKNIENKKLSLINLKDQKIKREREREREREK